ncbi:predicted protein [Histoplasma capsulatum var. duboisii H88]|uniref:Predicted protein n=1 Tax=Ajellomyces capsulatus (strain H88) TaxID=544711 RepID=F0UGV6_AJEC8|nr:predicted protein [Histoplasma capsulatum var. duboisii H88]
MLLNLFVDVASDVIADSATQSLSQLSEQQCHLLTTGMLAQLKWDHGVANDYLSPSLLKCHWAEHASSGPTRRHDPLDNERPFRQSADLIPRQYFSGNAPSSEANDDPGGSCRRQESTTSASRTLLSERVRGRQTRCRDTYYDAICSTLLQRGCAFDIITLPQVGVSQEASGGIVNDASGVELHCT